MKPFSLSAILLLSALAASAEVVMVSGTIYDVGKGSHCSDISAVNAKDDSKLCWAATSSNLLQHWQDAYLAYYQDKGYGSAAPDGTRTGYTSPSGTQYLEIFEAFRQSFQNYGANIGYASEWYFEGRADTGVLKSGALAGGYFKGAGLASYGKSFDPESTAEYNFRNLAEFQSTLQSVFQNKGFGVYLGIADPNYEGAAGHAITCWGYETDAQGVLCALYVTDSDDKQFGARRMEVSVREDGWIQMQGTNPLGSYATNRYVIGTLSYFTAAAGDVVAKSGNTALTASFLADKGGAVAEAVDATGQQLSYADKVSLEAGGMLVASGKDKGTSLTLSGTSAGLEAKVGSMVDLRNATLKISGSSGNGLSVSNEAYIAGGTVSITGNTGEGISVTNTVADFAVYLGLLENDSVYIAQNKTHGLHVSGDVSSGGTIKNAQVEIRGNKQVDFMLNSTTAQGGAILATGDLKLTGNTELNFTSNSSTNSTSSSAGGGAIAVVSEKGVTYTGGVHKGNAELTGNTNVNFKSNTATGNGGAIYASYGLKLSDNTTVLFEENQSTVSNWSCGGGAIAAYSSTSAVDISNNTTITFLNNTVYGQGGALYSTYGNISLSENKTLNFSGNKATGMTSEWGSNGGAIAASYGKVQIDANTNVYLQNNTAGNYGGAVYVSNGTFRLSGTKGTAEICGNTSTNGSAIYAAGTNSAVALNGNNILTISNNVTSSTGAVIYNAGTTEIAHNGAVTFSGNTAKHDVYNEGTLYLCADSGQSITFQHGFANSGTGTTTIGKDSAATASDAAGSYVFTNGTNSVTMETTVATVKAEGGMLFENSALTVSKAEFSDPIKFTLEGSSLKLSDIAFTSDAAMTVDFGYFEEKNHLQMGMVTAPAEGKVALTLKLDLNSSAVPLLASAIDTSTGLETVVYGNATVATKTIALKDYINVNDLSLFNLSLVVDGSLGEGTTLAIDTTGVEAVTYKLVTTEGYTYSGTNGNVIYYAAKAAEDMPEPTTGTLSMLALVALAARRRRKNP